MPHRGHLERWDSHAVSERLRRLNRPRGYLELGDWNPKREALQGEERQSLRLNPPGMGMGMVGPVLLPKVTGNALG